MLGASLPPNEYCAHTHPFTALINYLANICEQLHYNERIWFIAYWVGRQSNEITFWDDTEILNASFLFWVHLFLHRIWMARNHSKKKILSPVRGWWKDIEKEKNKTRLSNSLFVIVAVISNDCNKRFATSRCGILSLHKRQFHVAHLLLNHFQWAPDLLIPKRTGAK